MNLLKVKLLAGDLSTVPQNRVYVHLLGSKDTDSDHAAEARSGRGETTSFWLGKLVASGSLEFSLFELRRVRTLSLVCLWSLSPRFLAEFPPPWLRVDFA